MPKRPETIVPANPNHNKTDRLMRDMGTKDSMVTGWEIDPVRLAIIDSGCSSNTHPIDIALSRSPRKFRDLIKSIKFETAADPVVCSKGATVKYGAWETRWTSASHLVPRLSYQWDNALWKRECRSFGLLASSLV